MHCDKCKTVIEKGIIMVEALYGIEENNKEGVETLYCKKCFAKEFILNDNNKR
jgi:hypothetical protein